MPQALADFTAAHALAERAQSPEALGITAFGLARAYAANGQSTDALHHTQAALGHLHSIGHIYAQAVTDFARLIEHGSPPTDALAFTTAYGF